MKKSTLYCLALPAIFCLCLPGQAQTPLVLRSPAISPDASLVSFSYQGDIWTVPATGGRANRLTIHEGYESKPVFSPDGKQIAFQSERYGNADVFTMSAQGGAPTRLTFHSADDILSSWTVPDKILFSSYREYYQIARQPEILQINPAGGTEERIVDAYGYEPIFSPDGRYIAFVHAPGNPVFREDYTGPANREIWIYDTRNKTYKTVPAFKTNDVQPQWGGNRSLYFLSSEAGTYNIYRTQLDEKGNAAIPEKLTSEKDEAIRAFSVSANGSTLVYEQNMGLFLLKTSEKKGKMIDITMAADDRLDPKEDRTITSGADEYALSPNGKWMAFTVRGEVFVSETNKDRSRAVNISNHPFRDMNPAWLNDSTLLFSSDRADNNFDLYLAQSTDTAQTSLLKTLKREVRRLTNTPADELNTVVSQDNKKIAFQRGRGQLVVADVSETGVLSNEKKLQDGWATASDVSWSPDSKWLAYSISDLYFNQEVFIHAVDGQSQPVNVSMHPRTDRRPFWSADGSKLGFISARNNLSSDAWFVWLKKADWEKANQDWLEEDPPTPGTSAPKTEKKEPKSIEIDMQDIHQRIVQVTSLPGDERDLVITKEGESFLFTAYSAPDKGYDLFSVKWDGKDLKQLTKGGSSPFRLLLSPDGKQVYYARTGGSIARLDVKGGSPESLPYAGKMTLDYQAEREQIFEEAWRTVRDGFYDPQMHGYNWNELREKYRKRCIEASTGEDLRDMFNLMLGELNASHMGFTAAERISTQSVSTGLLGVELKPVPNGMRVEKVVPNSPASKVASELKVGDIITAVNGEKYNPAINFYQYLQSTANEKTLVSVSGSAGVSREVVIRPVSSLSQLLYEEWVDNCEKKVAQWSGGKLGYIHIQGMNMSSFEVVEREFMAAGYGKEGLVIDVRYNGGGSTTDYLMTVLNYKQHAYTIPRGASNDLEKDKLKFREYYPIGERMVFSPWLKPSIALCNENSYSNAEIFSHAYKNLGIGKLVGMPTNGSVISTGGRTLLDGSFVRLPFRGWFSKTTNQNQELGPAVPDIQVENPIDNSSDEQLKRAVDELMQTIKK